MNRARNAVVDFEVQFREDVFCRSESSWDEFVSELGGEGRKEREGRRTRVDGSLGHVTNGSRFDHVSDCESSDGFVLCSGR